MKNSVVYHREADDSRRILQTIKCNLCLISGTEEDAMLLDKQTDSILRGDRQGSGPSLSELPDKSRKTYLPPTVRRVM